jgi:hypothetical protein
MIAKAEPAATPWHESRSCVATNKHRLLWPLKERPARQSSTVVKILPNHHPSPREGPSSNLHARCSYSRNSSAEVT